MRWECQKQGRVLYVDSELLAGLLKSRLALLGPCSPNLLVLSDCMFRQQGEPTPKVDDKGGQQLLDDIIEAQKIDLVILDSLSTLALGSSDR
jgi:hypothetical protein